MSIHRIIKYCRSLPHTWTVQCSVEHYLKFAWNRQMSANSSGFLTDGKCNVDQGNYIRTAVNEKLFIYFTFDNGHYNDITGFYKLCDHDEKKFVSNTAVVHYPFFLNREKSNFRSVTSNEILIQ